jgi:O-antigen/teichoic acid export membrane protein
MGLFSFIKETLTDATKIATSKRRIQELFAISLYRNSIYLILNSGILALTGFFFWALATKLYPVEGVGLASAAISAMALLTLFSTLGLDYGLIRFLPSSGEKANEIVNSCFTISGLVSVALSIVFLAGLSIWSPALIFIRQNPVFFIAFLVFTAASTLLALAHQTFVARLRAGFALAQGLIYGLFRFIPLVFLASLFHTFGIFASWGIAVGIAVAVSIFLFLRRIQAEYRPLPTISRRAISDMTHFSFANYSANLFWMIPSLSLPLMVVNLLGAESNAYFYIGWAVANVLFMIPLAASLSLFAEGSHDEQKLVGDVTRSLKLTLLLVVPAIIIFFLAGDKILLLFGTAYSENATTLLRVLAVSALPASVNYIYFSLRRVEMRMKSVVGLSASIAVVTLALSFFLLPRMGILGAGVSYLIAQVIPASGISLWLLKRHRGQEV